MLVGMSVAAAALAPAQETAAPAEDVVVIGRQLRTVKITFYAQGSHLRRCDVTASSGVPLVDRTMCALVRSCLAAGETGRERAMRCVNNRIATLESGEGADPESLFDVPEPPAAPGGARAAVEAEKDDVVVTARRSVLRAGLWSFTEISWGQGYGQKPAGPYGQKWKRCIPPNQSDAGFSRALEPQRAFGANVLLPKECNWQVKAGNGQVSGRQRCGWGDGYRTGELQGSYTRDRLEVSKQRHWRDLGSARRGDATYEIAAIREGDC
ncbi:hypothetical protein DVW87_07770 [Sphingomonas aracearum]|uniref:Uncharacterized protein n=2 Tax=Sphingomonas aracearum TaxID=2283317 RepID=A0A369VUF2_9SPHN|nr:hypothetical protein DVW87_07770 [Sphingomonas aracearum]